MRRSFSASTSRTATRTMSSTCGRRCTACRCARRPWTWCGPLGCNLVCRTEQRSGTVKERLRAEKEKKTLSEPGRSECAPKTSAELFLPAVITETGLDIERYIYRGWFGPTLLGAGCAGCSGQGARGAGQHLRQAH